MTYIDPRYNPFQQYPPYIQVYRPVDDPRLAEKDEEIRKLREKVRSLEASLKEAFRKETSAKEREAPWYSIYADPSGTEAEFYIKLSDKGGRKQRSIDLLERVAQAFGYLLVEDDDDIKVGGSD